MWQLIGGKWCLVVDIPFFNDPQEIAVTGESDPDSWNVDENNEWGEEWNTE